MKIKNIDMLPPELQIKLSEKEYKRLSIIHNPGNVKGRDYEPKYDTGEKIE